MIDRAIFIDDENKLKLKAGDLFDKIINLKFYCRDKTTGKDEVFVLRSDYELVYTNQDYLRTNQTRGTGKVLVRRCTYKPSIKVQCKMVTSNTGTSVGITISNFFMLTKDGKHIRSFNESRYTITSIDIVMGYWGQLKDSLNTNVTDINELLDNYFDIKAVNGADKITISNGEPIVVTTEKLPPDSALHISGFVAGIYSSPVSITKVTSPSKALSTPVASSGTDLETLLFEQITKRYVNSHRIPSASNSLTNRTKLPVSASGSFMVDGKRIEADDNGQMKKADALEYGVKVFLSEKAKAVHIESLVDSLGNKQPRKLYFEAGWTIGQTLSRIMSYMDADLNYTFTLEGDVIVFVPSEMQEAETIGDMCEKKEVYKDKVFYNSLLYNGKLPAVYNINIDAVATIVCPFFTFIEPFQYVEFASRYALNSLVSYYADYNPSIHRFLVISASLSFATVDTQNEVQITAVSRRKTGDE